MFYHAVVKIKFDKIEFERIDLIKNKLDLITKSYNNVKPINTRIDSGCRESSKYELRPDSSAEHFVFSHPNINFREVNHIHSVLGCVRAYRQPNIHLKRLISAIYSCT